MTPPLENARLRATVRASGLLAMSGVALIVLPSPATAADARAAAIDNATAAISAHADVAFVAPGDRFAPTRVLTDADGGAHVRFSRTHRGLPVRGGDLVVHLAPSGAYEAMTVAQQAPITTDPWPARSAATAKAAAPGAFRGDVEDVDDPTLVVDATGAAPVLAHDTVVEGETPSGGDSRLHVLTDADTGARVDTYDDVLDVAGTAKTEYSGNRPVDTTQTAAGYSLIDPSYDRTSVCSHGGDIVDPCVQVAGASNVWGDNTPANADTAAGEVLYGVQKTTEFLESWFGRSQIFDDQTAFPDYRIKAEVHAGASDGRAQFQPKFDGAHLTFWDGWSQTGSKSPTQLDIVAHETGHALVHATQSLGASGEAAALNEASGDIIGTLTEFFASSSSNPDKPDWTIGELMNYKGTGKPIRTMYKPSLNGTGLDCWRSDISTFNPHDAAGVADKFFYLLSEGSGDPDGSGPLTSVSTCGAPAVQGIQRWSAARVWYRALTTYMTSTTQFATSGSNDARAATLSAATDLFGACSNEYQAVQAAWKASGVNGEDVSCHGTFTNASAKAIAAYGKAESQQTVSIPGTLSSSFSVTPNISYPKSGALTIDLVAPNGAVRRLLSPSTKTTPYQNVTYTVPGPVSPGGAWKLRVSTNSGQTGTLISWSIKF